MHRIARKSDKKAGTSNVKNFNVSANTRFREQAPNLQDMVTHATTSNPSSRHAEKSPQAQCNRAMPENRR